jgi:hypothetical protein
MLPPMNRGVVVWAWALLLLASCGRIGLPNWADAGTDAAPDPAVETDPRPRD